MMLAEAGSRLPSGSLSLSATSIVTVVSSGVLELSSTASGGSLAGSDGDAQRMAVSHSAEGVTDFIDEAVIAVEVRVGRVVEGAIAIVDQEPSSRIGTGGAGGVG